MKSSHRQSVEEIKPKHQIKKVKPEPPEEMKKSDSEKSIEPLNSPWDEEKSEVTKDDNEIETDEAYLSWTKEVCKKKLKSSDPLDQIKAHYRYGSIFEEEED